MARFLVQIGHQVTLFVIANHRKIGIVEMEKDGVHIIETPDLLWGWLRSGWDPWSLINRIMYLSKIKDAYDLVHCFETRPATIYPALFYSRRHNLPWITDWNDWWGRGGIIDEFRPKWYRILFGDIETYYEESFRTRADGLTVISTALAQRAEDLGVPPKKICHLPGGALPDLFKNRSKESCRSRIGLSLSIPILGFSSVDSHLDLELIVKSLAVIAKKYPTIKLMITGKAGKGILYLAEKYNVVENILLTGYLPLEDLPWYLGCADLFVLPFPKKIYNMGRWPNKIMDYMCLERPTVTNSVGDIKILFENHDVGVLADWDAKDFAQKIMFLLENPDYAQELGKNARQVAVTKYNWKVLIRRLEIYYYKVLDMVENHPSTSTQKRCV
jgi:glycosyltransferase involved in cell wall biosynthesis